MNTNEMPTGMETKEAKSEQPKMEEEKNVVAKEMAPTDVENIKKDDAERLNVAKQELEGFRKEQGGDSKKSEELLSLASQKLDEMQKEIDGKKNLIGRMLFGKQQFANAENAILAAREGIKKGILPEMHTIKNSVKVLANKVDVSEFPARKGKIIGGPNQSQY